MQIHCSRQCQRSYEHNQNGEARQKNTCLWDLLMILACPNSQAPVSLCESSHPPCAAHCCALRAMDISTWTTPRSQNSAPAVYCFSWHHHCRSEFVTKEAFCTHSRAWMPPSCSVASGSGVTIFLPTQLKTGLPQAQQ